MLMRGLLLLLLVPLVASADVVPTGRYGGVPTLSGCGTSPTLGADSFDSGGSINVGTGIVTACTLNFFNSGSFWTNPPKCHVQARSGTIAAFVAAPPTISALSIGISASLPGGVIDYLCW